MKKLLKFTLGLGLLAFLASCEKEEKPYTLPPPGPAKLDQVSMGSDYSKIIFYDLNTQKATVKSLGDWDLAFEANTKGIHALLNGGKGVQIAPMGDTVFERAYDVSKAKWKWDPTTFNLDSTAIGDWASEDYLVTGEVYLLDRSEKSNEEQYKKLKLVSVNDQAYVLRSSNLDGSDDFYFSVPKDERVNFIYLHLDKGVLADFEPPKDAWDFKFVRYRYVYYDMQPIVPYEVNGVILNPNNVQVADTRSIEFEDLTLDSALTLNFTTRRDFIGWDWKTYDFDAEAFVTDIKRIFVIKSYSDVYYKLRFIDFYDENGVKGAPSFELQRL